MVVEEKVALTLRPASVDEVLPFIEKAARHNTGGWRFDAERIAQRGLRFVFERDGVPVAGYVLEIRDDEVFVMAAGGGRDVDFTKIGLATIEGQATAFDSVAFETKRPALVKKALKEGYEIGGWIMRKNLR